LTTIACLRAKSDEINLVNPVSATRLQTGGIRCVNYWHGPPPKPLEGVDV